jgi:hypothetical protein
MDTGQPPDEVDVTSTSPVGSSPVEIDIDVRRAELATSPDSVVDPISTPTTTAHVQTFIVYLPCSDPGLRSINSPARPADPPDPRASEQMVCMVFRVGSRINPNLTTGGTLPQTLRH